MSPRNGHCWSKLIGLDQAWSGIGRSLFGHSQARSGLVRHGRETPIVRYGRAWSGYRVGEAPLFGAR